MRITVSLNIAFDLIIGIGEECNLYWREIATELKMSSKAHCSAQRNFVTLNLFRKGVNYSTRGK